LCNFKVLIKKEIYSLHTVKYRRACDTSYYYTIPWHLFGPYTFLSLTNQSVNLHIALKPMFYLLNIVFPVLQLIADFEEQGGPRIHHNGGDGQSVSSTGTASPELFSSDCGGHKSGHQRGLSLDSTNDVVVTVSDISSGIKHWVTTSLQFMTPYTWPIILIWIDLTTNIAMCWIDFFRNS